MPTDTKTPTPFGTPGVNVPALPGTPSPISVASLTQPQTPISVATPTPAPLPTITPPAATPTTTTATPASVTSELAQLTKQLAGKEADKAATTTALTAPVQQQLDEVNRQIAERYAQSIANQDKVQQMGGDTSFQAGEGQRIARNDAVQMLFLQARQAGLQNDFERATKLAESAINTKYAGIESEIQARKNNIYANYDTFSEAEKKAARAALLAINANDAFVQEKKADEAAVFTIAQTVQKNVNDPALVQRVLNAKDAKEALTIAGAAIQDPKAKLDLELTRADIALKRAQTLKTQKEASLVGQPSAEERKAQAEALKNSKEAIPVLQDKIALIDGLKSSPGLATAVGPIGLARTSSLLPFVDSPDAIIATADRQNFIAGVNQLINKETLDALVNLKAQGGTLGALSDGEREALRGAASKIGSWEIRNDKGQVTGYAIDEKSFTNELDNLQRLAKIALTKATGSVLSPDEKAVLDEVYSKDGALDPTFSPANYYK